MAIFWFSLSLNYSLQDIGTDMTFNVRRNILGAISVGKKIAYHLLDIGYSGTKGNYSGKLIRKSKWHAQYGTDYSN